MKSDIKDSKNSNDSPNTKVSKIFPSSKPKQSFVLIEELPVDKHKFDESNKLNKKVPSRFGKRSSEINSKTSFTKKLNVKQRVTAFESKIKKNNCSETKGRKSKNQELNYENLENTSGTAKNLFVSECLQELLTVPDDYSNLVASESYLSKITNRSENLLKSSEVSLNRSPSESSNLNITESFKSFAKSTSIPSKSVFSRCMICENKLQTTEKFKLESLSNSKSEATSSAGQDQLCELSKNFFIKSQDPEKRSIDEIHKKKSICKNEILSESFNKNRSCGSFCIQTNKKLEKLEKMIARIDVMTSKNLKQKLLNSNIEVNIFSENTDNVSQPESISESADTKTSKRDDLVTVWTLQPSSQEIVEHSSSFHISQIKTENVGEKTKFCQSVTSESRFSSDDEFKLKSPVNKTKCKVARKYNSKNFQDKNKHSKKHFKKEGNENHNKNKQTTKINSKVHKSNMVERILDFFEFSDHDVNNNAPYNFED